MFLMNTGLFCKCYVLSGSHLLCFEVEFLKNATMEYRFVAQKKEKKALGT